MSTQETKVTLQAEQRRCQAYLRERELNLPSHLQQNADILSTENHLEMINAKLEKIVEAEEAARAATAKLIADSVKKVTTLKDKLYKLREEIDRDVGKLHGNHKGMFFEVSQTLSQILQQHKPATKTKKSA